MHKMVKVKHPNGYTGILYGKQSMVIHDPEGHEVMHTGWRKINTEEQLYDFLERFPQVWKALISTVEG